MSYHYGANGNETSVVDNTGMSNGPSFTSNDKNQSSAIGSNSYTYSGPDSERAHAA